MGKWMRKGCFLACLLASVLLWGMTAAAKEGDAIKNGIFVGEVDLSGMTAQEAAQAVPVACSHKIQLPLPLIAVDLHCYQGLFHPEVLQLQAENLLFSGENAQKGLLYLGKGR